MPTDAQESSMAKAQRRKPMPSGLDPLVVILLQDQRDDNDALMAELGEFRKITSYGVKWALRILATGMAGVFVLFVILILVVAETRGVDASRVADGTTKILDATKSTPVDDTEPPSPEADPNG